MTSITHLQIGEQRVGPGEPCFVIAEAGVNHNGSLEMALKLVDVAVAAGADAVKFQKRDLAAIYPAALLNDPNSAEWAFQYLLPTLKQTELSDEDFRTIHAYCRERGIRFMCTAWDERSLAFLDELGVEAHKVASADLVNLPLLEKLVATGKPLIASTGMATLHEIERSVAFLKELGASFALLHCVSTYPAPFEHLNLRFLETLKQFGVPVGYSSHERGIAIPLVALSLGACIIEKHITLDRTLPGPDHPASLEPGGIQRLIRDIRNAETALGTPDKHLSAMEVLNREVLRKSLVATRDLPTGTLVTQEMVKAKGPGKGLSPQRIGELLGTRLERDVQADDYFTEGDLLTGVGKVIPFERLRRRWGFKARFHDLQEILAKKPKLVELHFSEADVSFAFTPPARPYEQQLFVHAPEFFDGKLLDLCSPDEELLEKSVELLQRTIDKAAELRPHFTGPVGLVIHVGGMSMDESHAGTETLLRRAADSLKRLDPRGITLLPENLPPRPWYLGGQWFQNVFIRPEELIEICQELGTGMTLDVSHAQLYCTAADRSLHDFVRLCLPYSRHLHLADATGIDGEGVQVGEGVIEWEELAELLADEDFTWVPEIWSGHLHHAAGFVEATNRLSQFDVF
jgi:sialic acid synthase SpsE/sugar phosphate isomerase/epimerase